MKHEQCGMGSGTCVISLLIFLSSSFTYGRVILKPKGQAANSQIPEQCCLVKCAMDSKSVLAYLGILRQVISDVGLQPLRSMKNSNKQMK